MKNYISYNEWLKIKEYFSLNYNNLSKLVVYNPQTFEPATNYNKTFQLLQVSNIDEFWIKVKQLEVEGWDKEHIKDFYNIT